MRELLLPVSPKNEETPSAARSVQQSSQENNILYRYRFAGDLREAQDGAELKRKTDTEADAKALADTGLLWYPAEQIYGLALRRGDTYETPRSALTLSADHEGELRFLIRFLPLEEGVILNAVLGKDRNAAAIALFFADGSLTLSLEGQENESSVTGVSTESLRSFITAEITVNIHADRITAQLGLGVPWEATEETPFPDRAEIPLTEPVGGELISLLGDLPAETATAVAAPAIAPATATAVADPTVVLDDFAVIFRLPE
jgi:hypothetical protein